MIEIKQLAWDNGNVNHIKKHKVSVDEVEEVCQKIKKSFKSYQGRLIILGKTKKSRLLTVALAPEGQRKYYAVTARDMSHKERRILK